MIHDNYTTNSTAQKVLDALLPFNLKSEGNGEWRCNSPFRSGSNSMGFCITISDDEHGAYIDNPSGESGSLYDLAKKLGISISNHRHIINTKREYAGMKDYAIAHGVSNDTLREWGWSEIIHHQRRALEFTTSNGVRYRFIDGDTSKSVYISTKGYKSCWYGITPTLSERLKAGLPLVICNGEISTIAGQTHGLASICMTAGEKGKIPDNLMIELKAYFHDLDVKPQIIIALDCDKTGRHSAHGLMAQLRGEGFTATAINLDLGDKGDLADFCRLHESDSPAKITLCPLLTDETAITIDKPFRILNRHEMYHLPPIEWLIPYRLPKCGIMAIYGKSGTFKSFYALDLALNMGTESPILYVAAEGFFGYSLRLRAWETHNSEMANHADFLDGDVDLFDESSLKMLIDSIKAQKYVLVVIDTFAMVSGDADENSTRDMNRMVKGCKRIIHECNTALILVHHTGKAGTDERGSSALRGAMDSMIKLTEHDTLKDVVKVTCEKMKDAPKFEPFQLQAKTINLGYTDSLGNPTTSKVLEPFDGEQISPNGLTNTQMMVLRLIIHGNMERTQANIARVTGKGTGTISKIIAKLVEMDFITRHEGIITPTPKGVQLIASIASTTSISNKLLESSQPPLIDESMEVEATHDQHNINLQKGHY